MSNSPTKMTTTITATCACASFSHSISFDNALLPLPRTFCLCTDCRLTSGSCGNTYIPLPPTIPINISDFPTLKSYASSVENLVRYFCGKCSAHIFCHRPRDNKWWLASGIWDRTEGVIEWKGCKWVKATGDGGISPWLKDIQDGSGNKRELKRWLSEEDGDVVPEGSFLQLPSKPKERQGDDTLKAQCHCGGVKFHITRPTEESTKVYSPFSDLIIPYNSTTSAKNPNVEPWFLRENNTKYLAGTCVCTSCRLQLGFEIQTWAFIPKCNIFKPDGSPIDFKFGTLKRYYSSPGVYREFCGTCGANVFWHCDERPELLDVSIGILDPEEGARVEGWLDWWTERASFRELAVSTTLVESLEAGMKAWGEKKAHGYNA